MRRRLNDTAAIAALPEDSEMTRTTSVRKISNGYLVRESTCNPGTGEYRSNERFSRKPLSVETDRPVDAAGSAGLSETMDYMKGEKY